MNAEADRLRELLAINRAITSTDDYDEALRLVVEKARALTGAHACLLLLAEPGSTATIAASAGSLREVRKLAIILDERLDDSLRTRFGLRARDDLVAVPMILRGDVRGGLVVVHRHEERAGRSEEVALLSALADQAAIALGHAAHLRELHEALAAAERERQAREDALADLAAERAYLRAVIASSPVATILVERADERITANTSAEALFGPSIRIEAGMLQYAAQLRTPDGALLPSAELPAQQALRGVTVHRELAVQRPDGRLVPVMTSAAPILEEGRGILGAVILHEDISPLKELERLREEWTSIVAHDLRQPLLVISMTARHLTRRSDPSDPGAQQLEVIRRSAENLDRMIDDLLDSSLAETNRLALSRQPHPVRPLLEGTIERNALAIRQPITLAADDALPDVLVDARRIEQVLTNLLLNASKYGAPDTPIQVRATTAGDQVEVSVQNAGPRIDPETARTLFERFRRGRDQEGQGLGLGLYISKGLIEAHGGRIWVDSGTGWTAFHFTLPVR